MRRDQFHYRIWSVKPSRNFHPDLSISYRARPSSVKRLSRTCILDSCSSARPNGALFGEIDIDAINLRRIARVKFTSRTVFRDAYGENERVGVSLRSGESYLIFTGENTQQIRRDS